MPKKKTPTTRPPTVITITRPDEGLLPRTGQILVQRGTLAIIRQFAYSSLSEISAAIQQAAASLIQLEQNRRKSSQQRRRPHRQNRRQIPRMPTTRRKPKPTIQPLWIKRASKSSAHPILSLRFV